MFSLARKSILAAALGATALVSASPAAASDHRRHKQDDMVGAVLLGVLTVAAIAVVVGGDVDDRQSCDGGRDDPDFCYGGRSAETYPADYDQTGYSQGGEDRRNQDYRQDQNYGEYEANNRSDEYEQDDEDAGW
ncbi:MAG: hypothetical protein ABL914_13495 [Novosphingobium sp.]|uniref:hypothetical protein n=1 Tax=Novosphingobium sp. TaxID=1874826 RepID=UPI0032BABDC2